MKELFKRWQNTVDEVNNEIANLSIAVDDWQENQRETLEYREVDAALEDISERLDALHEKIDKYSKISARIRKLPIKFRAKIKDSDEYIQGWYAEGFNDDGKKAPRIIYDTENPAYWYEVEPDSVAQLVGYDAEGNEVYEGDEVKVYRGAFRQIKENEKPYDVAVVKTNSKVGNYGELDAYDDYQFLKV